MAKEHMHVSIVVELFEPDPHHTTPQMIMRNEKSRAGERGIQQTHLRRRYGRKPLAIWLSEL